MGERGARLDLRWNDDARTHIPQALVALTNLHGIQGGNSTHSAKSFGMTDDASTTATETDEADEESCEERDVVATLAAQSAPKSSNPTRAAAHPSPSSGAGSSRLQTDMQFTASKLPPPTSPAFGALSSMSSATTPNDDSQSVTPVDAEPAWLQEATALLNSHSSDNSISTSIDSSWARDPVVKDTASTPIVRLARSSECADGVHRVVSGTEQVCIKQESECASARQPLSFSKCAEPDLGGPQPSSAALLRTSLNSLNAEERAAIDQAIFFGMDLKAAAALCLQPNDNLVGERGSGGSFASSQESRAPLSHPFDGIAHIRSRPRRATGVDQDSAPRSEDMSSPQNPSISKSTHPFTVAIRLCASLEDFAFRMSSKIEIGGDVISRRAALMIYRWLSFQRGYVLQGKSWLFRRLGLIFEHRFRRAELYFRRVRADRRGRHAANFFGALFSLLTARIIIVGGPIVGNVLLLTPFFHLCFHADITAVCRNRWNTRFTSSLLVERWPQRPAHFCAFSYSSARSPDGHIR